ncbi:MAG: hypothetical protein LW852_12205 [Sediminibacterium sp.]|jgi:hypothetical protein|nr:hypothetical protein [Sediminibacterium sp.]
MKKEVFYTSKEVKTYLKIQDCDLAHTRQTGKLKYIKSGNSYLYYKDSVEQLKEENLK